MDNSFRENLLKNLLLVGGLSSLVNLPILYQVSFIFASMVLGFSIIYLVLFLGLFKNLCQSGKITITQGNTDEDRNRCRAVCS